MGNALFYHLTRSRPETLLPILLGKALAAGWRTELRGNGVERMEALDSALWNREGFLPHGLAGGPYDGRQPVLLRDASAPPATNSPDCLMAIDGSEVTTGEAKTLARVCIIFDGHDSVMVERARGQWRDLIKAGVMAEYWSEAGGRWEKKK